MRACLFNNLPRRKGGKRGCGHCVRVYDEKLFKLKYICKKNPDSRKMVKVTKSHEGDSRHSLTDFFLCWDHISDDESEWSLMTTVY